MITFRVQLVVSEIISLTLLKSGGVESLELKGDLAVQVLISVVFRVRLMIHVSLHRLFLFHLTPKERVCCLRFLA